MPTDKHSQKDKRHEPETARKTEQSSQTRETGGPKGPEPTRYGDWERRGRCIDF